MKNIYILGLLLACNGPAIEQDQTLEDVSDIPIPSESIEEDTGIVEDIPEDPVTINYTFNDVCLFYRSLQVRTNMYMLMFVYIEGSRTLKY